MLFRSREVRTNQRQLSAGDRLAIVTDGIRSEGRARLSEPARDVQDLASDLVHRFARTHDDATCVLLCLRSAP